MLLWILVFSSVKQEEIGLDWFQWFLPAWTCWRIYWKIIRAKVSLNHSAVQKKKKNGFANSLQFWEGRRPNPVPPTPCPHPIQYSLCPSITVKLPILTSSKSTQNLGIVSIQKHEIKLKITENLLKGGIKTGYEWLHSLWKSLQLLKTKHCKIKK